MVHHHAAPGQDVLSDLQILDRVGEQRVLGQAHRLAATDAQGRQKLESGD